MINPFHWFTSKNTTLQQPDEWFKDALSGPRTASGESVDAESAMRVASVYACVRVIAETVAAMPVNIFVRDGENRERDSDHPLNDLLKVQPNPMNTPFQLFENVVDSVLLGGKSVNEVVRDNNGGVREIWPTPGKCRTEVVGKELIFRVQTKSGEERTLRANGNLYVPGLTTRGIIDQTPIGIVRDSIGNAIALDKFSGDFFANGATPGGILEYPGTLKDDQYKKMKAAWDSRHKGSGNSNKTALLEGGVTFKQISVNPEDAQFIDVRKFSTSEIARIFRVPPHMIGDLEKATFSNIEHQSIDFLQHTIRPWLIRIEQAMNVGLLTNEERKTHFIKFNSDALMRGDSKGRAEFYNKGLTDGWLSPNEVRKLEDRNPIEGGDDYRVPLNTGPMNDESEPSDDDDSDDDEGESNTQNNVFRNDAAARISRFEQRGLKEIFNRGEHSTMPADAEKFYKDQVKPKLKNWLHLTELEAEGVANKRLKNALKMPFVDLMKAREREKGLDIIDLIDNEAYK